jgi:hypothetical protein
LSIVSNPIDAGRRFECIVDDIAQAKANVKLFFDRLQGGPIGMDVGDQKNTHQLLFFRFSDTP